jgi:hypothetical protein
LISARIFSKFVVSYSVVKVRLVEFIGTLVLIVRILYHGVVDDGKGELEKLTVLGTHRNCIILC